MTVREFWSAPPRRYPISSYLSILPETEVMYLPPGIGAQARLGRVGRTDRGARDPPACGFIKDNRTSWD